MRKFRSLCLKHGNRMFMTRPAQGTPDGNDIYPWSYGRYFLYSLGKYLLYVRETGIVTKIPENLQLPDEEVPALIEELTAEAEAYVLKQQFGSS